MKVGITVVFLAMLFVISSSQQGLCWKKFFSCTDTSTNPLQCCSIITNSIEKDRECFCNGKDKIKQNFTLTTSMYTILAHCSVPYSYDTLCPEDLSWPTSDSSTDSTVTPNVPSSSTATSHQSSAQDSTSSSSSNNRGNLQIIIPVIIIGVVVVVVTVAIVICLCLRKKKHEAGKPNQNVKDVGYNELPQTPVSNNDIVAAESLQYELKTLLEATNNFSDEQKIGRGGFGAVYKGVLSDGTEIAVKRLSNGSSQGDKEFKNEMLRSYSYPERQGQLNWPIRYNIIKGVARGMLYLHDDSPVRIIHRDLKAANVLLDADMNAKVADFGMARICALDETHIDTSRVVGTFGYMSPEYLLHGQFSIKSDVYSFGALVLEIISGQKVIGFMYQSEGGENLLLYAWKCWCEEKTSELIDPTLKDSCSTNEVMKCINLGLMCVQEDVTKRPTMETIVHMLNYNDFDSKAPSMLQPPAYLYSSGSDQSTTTKSNTTSSLASTATRSNSHSMPWSRDF
ncbi:Cysteine-rich receptor-like protein kinase 10 [Bienertia sinuspersici]